ncbi:MAG: hypothetical protein WKF58_02890 [Ilumatobacteraceae bacterium]
MTSDRIGYGWNRSDGNGRADRELPAGDTPGDLDGLDSGRRPGSATCPGTTSSRCDRAAKYEHPRARPHLGGDRATWSTARAFTTLR